MEETQNIKKPRTMKSVRSLATPTFQIQKLTGFILVKTHREFTKMVIAFVKKQGYQSVSRYIAILIYKELGIEEETPISKKKGAGKKENEQLVTWVGIDAKKKLQNSATMESVSDRVRRLIVEDLKAHGEEVDESKVKLSNKKVKA